MKKLLKITGITASVIIILGIVVYTTTYHPALREQVPFTNVSASVPANMKSLKVLSWNVQYMASKNYVFFYDLLDGSGPDSMPAMNDVHATITRIAEVINEEDPDIVLIQEMDDNARRTGYINERDELLKQLNYAYNYSEAWYWKAAFVPHPKIMGRVGMKLLTLSKYPIVSAVRHQLPIMRDNPLTKQFNFKRAVLEVTIDIGHPLVVMNTHLDAFAQGEDTMLRQVETVRGIIHTHDSGKALWLIGGDFNLLMPGIYAAMPDRQKAYYNPTTELALLTDLYQSVPSLADATGNDKDKWFTHFPNDPVVKAADRTIDYIFYSPLFTINQKTVKSDEKYRVSDHYPIITILSLLEKKTTPIN